MLQVKFYYQNSKKNLKLLLQSKVYYQEFLKIKNKLYYFKNLTFFNNKS